MDELELLRQRIQQLEKELTEIRQNISDIAFDLRVPLIPIKGFIRTLLDDNEEEQYTCDDRHEFYMIIEYNTDRLDFLINDLIQGSYIKRRGTDGMVMNWQEDVDVHKIIEHVAEIQRGRTEKHALVLDLAPDHILIETDPEKFENILHNLINNAIQYSPEGGEIRVITRLETPNEVYPCGALLMQVKDQGLGISMQDLQKLGQRYGGTLKAERRAGTGIGLFLTKKLVEAHHGVLWPESEGFGKGATFNIRIPLKQPKNENSREASDPTMC